MTHFDFKTLLPALLQVEDRVSMAHGLESRVPFLDHPLVELAATIPADVKFKDGSEARAASRRSADAPAVDRATASDKMGFPVPLQEWLDAAGPCASSSATSLVRRRARPRPLVDNGKVLARPRDRAAVRPQSSGGCSASSSGSRSSTTDADRVRKLLQRTGRGIA